MNRYSLLTCTLAVVAACNQWSAEGYAGGDTALPSRAPREREGFAHHGEGQLLAVKERQLSFQSAMIGDAATTSRLIPRLTVTSRRRGGGEG